jgi:hypothetical protein
MKFPWVSSLKRECTKKLIFSWNKELHNFVGCMSCFSHKPEKFQDKIRAKTFLGENIGPDVKVLVPMWNYWSLDITADFIDKTVECQKL